MNRRRSNPDDPADTGPVDTAEADAPAETPSHESPSPDAPVEEPSLREEQDFYSLAEDPPTEPTPTPPPEPTPGPGPGPAEVDLEQRVRRLEEALALLQQGKPSPGPTPTPAGPNGGPITATPPAAIPTARPLPDPPPGRTPPVAKKGTSWLFWDMLVELRVFWRMYTDPRYEMTWFSRLVPLALVVIFFLSSWFLPLASVPIFGWVFEKIGQLVVAYVLVKSLSSEARRYRQTAPDLPASLRL